MSLFQYDRALLLPSWCGIDEAGRGPLAGPVYAACVVFTPDTPIIEGLNDSKKLTAKRRDALYDEIIATAADYAVASASVEEIERLNILQAAMLAMKRAYDALHIKPATALVDGNKAPDLGDDVRCLTVVKGDGTSAAIAAASILAKVSRDRDCLQLHKQYPEYAFDRHKGYGTKLHYEKLREFGPCPAHRPSFLRSMGSK